MYILPFEDREQGLTKICGFTYLDGFWPDTWRYVVEVEWAGRPAEVTGYR